MRDSDPLRERLLCSDEELRHLSEQHEALDVRLRELSGRLYRSISEEQERATLKKRKLQLKDRMEDLMRRQRDFARAQASASLQLPPHG